MKLYHGSNMRVIVPDLSRSKPFKDFGSGFYLSDNYGQAMDSLQKLIHHLENDDTHFLQKLIEELKYAKGITFQYFFGTERAIQKLRAL